MQIRTVKSRNYVGPRLALQRHHLQLRYIEIIRYIEIRNYEISL